MTYVTHHRSLLIIHDATLWISALYLVFAQLNWLAQNQWTSVKASQWLIEQCIHFVYIKDERDICAWDDLEKYKVNLACIADAQAVSSLFFFSYVHSHQALFSRMEGSISLEILWQEVKELQSRMLEVVNQLSASTWNGWMLLLTRVTLMLALQRQSERMPPRVLPQRK